MDSALVDMSLVPALHSTITKVRPRATSTHASSITTSSISADFIPPAAEIKAGLRGRRGDAGGAARWQPDSVAKGRIKDYDPDQPRCKAFKFLREHFNAGEIVTGLLYVDESREEMHNLMGNVDTPLCELPLDSLHPGAEELKRLQRAYK